MSTLVIAEHDNSSLKGATLNTVAAAQAMGADIDILIAMRLLLKSKVKDVVVEFQQKPLAPLACIPVAQ